MTFVNSISNQHCVRTISLYSNINKDLWLCTIVYFQMYKYIVHILNALKRWRKNNNNKKKKLLLINDSSMNLIINFFPLNNIVSRKFPTGINKLTAIFVFVFWFSSKKSLNIFIMHLNASKTWYFVSCIRNTYVIINWI